MIKISIDFTETKEKERIKKYHKKYQETCEKKQLLQLYLKVYNQNAEKLIVLENIDTIIDIINQYKGKKHGPKTKDKICLEIRNKINIGAIIDKTHIHIYNIGTTSGCLDIYTKYGKKNYYKIIDGNNVIQEMAKEMFDLPDKSEIIENVEEYTEQKKKEFAELKSKYDKLCEEISKYIENNPFEHQNIRKGINYMN